MRRAPLSAHQEDVREDSAESTRQVILFDGVYQFCIGFVQLVPRRDPAGHFAFAPRQSEFARHRLGAIHLDSIVLAESGEVIYAEIALFRILSRWNRTWPWLTQVAGCLVGSRLGATGSLRYRGQLFGRDDICALTQPGWKDQFLT